MTQRSEAILFFTPFGYWQVHTQLDLAVASAARLRGLRTTYVTCDAFYQPCTIERGEDVCVACQASMREIAAPFGITGEKLGALMRQDEIETAEAWVRTLDDGSLVTATYENLEIGDWAVSSVMTHFRVGNLADLSRPEIVAVHRRFLRDTLLTYWAIGRLIDRDGIDAVFLFNARFYPYRAALEASRRRDVRVLVHERGRVANSFSFFENESCLSTKTADELVADWADRPLDDGKLQQVDQHFSQLLRGLSPNWPSFYDEIKSDDPRAVLGIPTEAKIIGFFSSSSDEIAAQISFAKVTSQFALIEEIAAILEEAGVYLVVRHHPHIGGGPVGSPVESSAFFEAYSRTRSRRSNVRIVMPKDDVASYALFPFLSAAIAPFTSLGLEAAAFGIPTLVSRGSISSFDADYTIEDWSRPALKEKIAFVLGADAALNGERLRKFYRTFYSRFHRFSLRFSAVAIKDYIEASVHPDVAELVQPGRDRALDLVMDCLVEGRHVHERPDPGLQSSQGSNATNEDDFISDRLSAIRYRSESRQQAVPERASDRNMAGLAILCEETAGAPAAIARLRALPNADRVSIVSFSPEPLDAWLRVLRLIPGFEDFVAFKAWSLGLRKALRGVAEDHVMVLSARHQLHDASIGMVLSHVEKVTPPARRIVSLAGWFGDATQLRPHRVSASTLTPAQWRQLRANNPGTLRGQDVLSLGIVNKRWLCTKLKSAAALQTAFVSEVAKTTDATSASPVFLWQ